VKPHVSLPAPTPRAVPRAATAPRLPATADDASPVGVVERARAEWGLRYDEIARALGADESTLHRWRARATSPSRAFRTRLAALSTLMAAVARHHDGADAARAWLECPLVALGGYTPRALLATGRTELLVAVLTLPDAVRGALEAAPPPSQRAR
jgi:uncharacterized protein (DUF2384 family)